MGYQCNIILTYYTEQGWEEKEEQIFAYLASGIRESEIRAAGNRNWEPLDMQTHVICMKNWDEAKCLEFIEFLKTIKWDVPESVQVYYCSVPDLEVNWTPFKLVNIFP